MARLVTASGKASDKPSGFASTMLAGAAACFLHGLFPFAFQKSGSRRIIALHERMVANRHRNPAAEPSVAG